MEKTHLCRCHVCGHTSENTGDRITHCSQCQKPIGRFYYFDDRLTAIYTDESLRPEYSAQEVKPLWGLTAYWETS